MNFIKIVLLTGLGLGLWTGCPFPVKTDLEIEGALVAGVLGDDPPFEVRGETGEVSGVHVEMAEDLGLYLNREVRFEVLEAGEVKDAVVSGRVDLVFLRGKMSNVAENGVAFSDGYAWMGLAFLTGVDSEVGGVEDLNAEGRVVVVVRESLGNVFVRTAMPRAEVRVLEDGEACVAEVLGGRADAFVHDGLSVYAAVDARPESLRAVLEPFRREAWVLGVRRENKALLDAVNDFLVDYREIGGFDRLAERYFGEVREAFAVQGAAFMFDPPEALVSEDAGELDAAD